MLCEAALEFTPVFFWLLLTVFFIIAELISVGLTSIWFAIGALVSLVVAICNGPIWLQVVLFFIVSIVTLIATRPLSKKYINRKFQPTNADSHIGEQIVIKETVDNRKETGMAVVRGQEWTVRALKDDQVIPEGAYAKVVKIEGVKLIVEKTEVE